MRDTYSDTFVPIYYHFNGGGYRAWVITRSDFYIPGTFYVPHMFMDGYDEGTNYNLWNSDYLARQPVTTDVTIDVEASLFGITLDATGTVCVEAGGTAKTMRVYMVQVLDHYPPTPTYYRNCFRLVHIEDVTVDAGACVDVEHTFTLTTIDTATPEDIGVVVWAQQPLDAGPAEVYQAGKLFSPTLILYRSDFESGELTDWSLVVP